VNAPTIHQEIITHHRHIDHGFEVVQPAPAPLPPPPPPAPREPSPPRTVFEEEIDIKRRNSRNGRRYDDEIIIDRKIRTPQNDRARTPLPPPAPREPSPPPRPKSGFEIDIRRSGTRNGEQFNEDIRIDRMDGVRRSDLVKPRDRERTEIRERRYVGGKPVDEKMWTEITKDLVVREALEGCGYEIEETEHFFYVMEYLGYNDVLRLVRISDDIRRDRKERIRQLEWEQRHPRRPALPPAPPVPAIAAKPWDEERIYEREIIYDRAPKPRVIPRPPPPPLPPVAPRREVTTKEQVEVIIR